MDNHQIPWWHLPTNIFPSMGSTGLNEDPGYNHKSSGEDISSDESICSMSSNETSSSGISFITNDSMPSL